MAELVAYRADTGDVVVNDVILIFFTYHICRAGIEAEIHAIEHGRLGEIFHVRPQVVPVVGAIVRAMSGNQEEHHIDGAILVSVIPAKVHLRVKCLKSSIKNGVAIELVGVGACKRHIHRSQDVKVRVKLLERVVIVVISHAAHAVNSGSCWKRETIVVMAINHGFIEVKRRII